MSALQERPIINLKCAILFPWMGKPPARLRTCFIRRPCKLAYGDSGGGDDNSENWANFRHVEVVPTAPVKPTTFTLEYSQQCDSQFALIFYVDKDNIEIIKPDDIIR